MTETTPVGNNPIQLYSMATPNGKKLGIALEELELKYDAHLVNISKGDQFKPWFLAINPNNKIPALVDREGIDGTEIKIFESGAILIYLAEKTGKLLAKSGKERYQTLEWLMWQMGGVGPMFGQFGHFFAQAKEDVPYAKERYLTEVKRLLQVLDTQLSNHTYISGEEYTIADIATWPWIDSLITNHKHRIDKTYEKVEAWHAKIKERPAVQRGIKVCGF